MRDAAAIVREAGGLELLERLEHLDAIRANPRRDDDPPLPPDRGTRADFDVVLAGGGLSILYAPLLARAGVRVAIFERGRIGVAHREWNASAAELQALVSCGLLTPGELDGLVVARYRHGICRWHRGGTWPVTRVLDHAVDAGALLALARRRAEEAGVFFAEGHELVGHAAGPDSIALRFCRAGGRAADVTARLLLDCRGASSPHATGDLLCPTVGGVIEGISTGEAPDQIDPGVGEILATTGDLEEGRQQIWEAFPGRPGQTTVYLFHYAPAHEVGAGALIRLYGRFFESLPRYKRGATRLVRPTFGFIPGWSRLAPPPAPPSQRIVLLGDAAARHSPLTFCGFGATLRSLSPGVAAICTALAQGREDRLETVVDDRPIHRGTGALAMMMARPDRKEPGELNDLLDAAFATLHSLGDDAYGALLRDEMAPGDLVRFLLRMAPRRPRVFRDFVSRLGPDAAGRWAAGLGLSLIGWRDQPSRLLRKGGSRRAQPLR